MLVNCGYGRSSCDRATFAPLMLVPGSNPANGFATWEVRKLLVASSRTGEVEKYWPGTASSSRETGICSEYDPRYVPSIRKYPGSSRWTPIDQRCVRGAPTAPPEGKFAVRPTFVISPRALPTGSSSPFGNGLASVATKVWPLSSDGVSDGVRAYPVCIALM